MTTYLVAKTESWLGDSGRTEYHAKAIFRVDAQPTDEPGKFEIVDGHEQLAVFRGWDVNVDEEVHDFLHSRLQPGDLVLSAQFDPEPGFEAVRLADFHTDVLQQYPCIPCRLALDGKALGDLWVVEEAGAPIEAPSYWTQKGEFGRLDLAKVWTTAEQATTPLPSGRWVSLAQAIQGTHFTMKSQWALKRLQESYDTLRRDERANLKAMRHLALVLRELDAAPPYDGSCAHGDHVETIRENHVEQETQDESWHVEGQCTTCWSILWGRRTKKTDGTLSTTWKGLVGTTNLHPARKN